MPVKHRILCVFWAIHLALCVLCVLPEKFQAAPSRAWRLLTPYGVYTGAANRYGFFAPNVPSARRVRVRVLCGEEWVPIEPPVSSSESQLRVLTVSSLVMHKEMEETVAASWAAFALNSLPCAKTAVVETEYYGVPTMSDYRRGERPNWSLLHVLAFMTKEQLKSVEESRQ
jgi:hypothetical protein